MTNELEARIKELESTVAAHEAGLRFLYKVLQARIDAAQDEAEALIPDNRVDGNGIRIADLEAVEDDLV
jgi:hypothetical protein